MASPAAFRSLSQASRPAASAASRWHIRLDLGAGPGLLGVDLDAAPDSPEGPQVDTFVDAQPFTDRGPLHRTQLFAAELDELLAR
ncbi:hypothetical protein [Streptomyces cellulosae]|uniref:Uncharacterized protein n=1 Tax=Streptomyces cellulosae TaxID=1968 RepID=A0ABW7YBE9_STRCE